MFLNVIKKINHINIQLTTFTPLGNFSHIWYLLEHPETRSVVYPLCCIYLFFSLIKKREDVSLSRWIPKYPPAHCPTLATWRHNFKSVSFFFIFFLFSSLVSCRCSIQAHHSPCLPVTSLCKGHICLYAFYVQP